MGKEAIHEDVSVFGSDRLARINAISASRQDDKEQDDEDALAVLAEQTRRLDEDLANADSEYDDEDSGAECVDDDSDAKTDGVIEDAAPKTLKLKVNGQEREMTMEQVIAIAQKQEAADARLQEAARRIQEAEAREAQLREFEAKVSNSQPSAQDVGNMKKKAREYHEALLDGDDERADELLVQIQSGRQHPTLNESQLADSIYRTIEQKNVEARRQAEILEAQSFFSSEFADIAKDKLLYDVADKFTIEVMQENPTLSPKEVVTEAGKRTRDWYGMKESNQRTERKQKAASGGMSGNNARRAGNPAPKPKSRTDILNDIRAGRGAATF